MPQLGALQIGASEIGAPPGGGSTIPVPTLLAHGSAVGAGAATTATTSPLNTTGADLIVAYVVADAAGTQVFSDSAGNTWAAMTNHPAANPNVGRFFYCLNPTTSSSHTFSYNASYPLLLVQAWNSTGYHLGYETGAAGGGSTIAPGSLSAPGNSLAIAGVGEGGSGATYSIDSSFSISDQSALVGGQHYGGAIAYKIISGAATSNPTWSSTASAAINAGQALFTSVPGNAELSQIGLTAIYPSPASNARISDVGLTAIYPSPASNARFSGIGLTWIVPAKGTSRRAFVRIIT